MITLLQAKRIGNWCAGIAIAALAACASVPGENVRKELVPTGKPRGVTVSLGQALADRLGVPLELVIYPNSGEVTAAGSKGEWDVAFLPEDAKRRKVVEFGPAYYLSTSTFMVRPGSPIEVVAKMKAGEVDAIALGRESLRGLAPQLPGARILDGHFHAAGTAVAVPKGKPAAHAYVTQFIEEAKTDGTVRRALDGAGFGNLPVAPPEPRR